MLTLTLTTGEIVTGRPNYVTVKLVEILSGGKLRTIERAQIDKVERAKPNAEPSAWGAPITTAEANAEVAAMIAESDA